MTKTSNIKTGLRAVTAIAVIAAAFVLPAQAIARDDCSNVGSDPTQAQYCSPSAVQTGGNAGTTATSTPNASGTAAASTSSGTSSTPILPFTGLDLAILLAVAGILTVTGLALRRLSASGGERH